MTPRRLQVLKLLATGLTAKEIGVILGISYRTVEWLRGELLYWFEAKNTSHMIDIAFKEGVLIKK